MGASTTQDKELAQLGHVSNLNREWEEVLHFATKRQYPKGTTIAYKKGAGMYYLASGMVTISYFSSCGRERLALCINPGCLFNEARTVSGYEPVGRFLCITDTTLYRFPLDLLCSQDFIRTYPHLITNLMRSMGMKMLIHYTFLASMGTEEPVIHLSRFILSLFRKHQLQKNFPCGMTQQEVANLLGIHRATLARAIVELKEKNIITKFTRNEVCINNIDDLRNMADLELDA